jgi:hypothetical protein
MIGPPFRRTRTPRRPAAAAKPRSAQAPAAVTHGRSDRACRGREARGTLAGASGHARSRTLRGATAFATSGRRDRGTPVDGATARCWTPGDDACRGAVGRASHALFLVALCACARGAECGVRRSVPGPRVLLTRPRRGAEAGTGAATGAGGDAEPLTAAAGLAAGAPVGAAGVAGTGAGGAGVGGIGTEGGGGRNESGSRYPSGSDATRIPRWTYGSGTSASPLGPTVPTISPSSTGSPRRTLDEPRCVSVTE